MTRFASGIVAMCLASLGLLSACEGLNQVGQGFKQAMDESLAGVAPGGGVPQELRGLFARAPLDVNAPFNKQFPRVAFSVLSSPPNHGQQVQILVVSGQSVPRACWRLGAKLWTDQATSKDVPPFTVCMPDILSGAAGVPLAGYENWAIAGQTQINRTTASQSTGILRTLGPVPPDTPFPTSAAYTAYYNRYPSGTTEEGFMWAGLLYEMRFDWQNIRDRRFWVAKYSVVEG